MVLCRPGWWTCLQVQQDEARKRFESFEDRGLEVPLFGRAVLDKLTGIYDHLWSRCTSVGLRDMMDWSVSYAMSLRGEHVRSLNLSDISSIAMPPVEGPQRATLVAFFYRQGKTIKLGSKGHITGMMRHVNVDVSLVQFEAMVAN